MDVQSFFGETVQGGEFGAPRPGISNGKHNGRDFKKPTYRAEVRSPADCERLIINSRQLNWRAVNGQYVPTWEPTIVFETPAKYWYDGKIYALYIIVSHLLKTLPLPNKFSANTLLSYQSGVFPYHFEVQLKLGNWVDITYGEKKGWAVDPLSIKWQYSGMDEFKSWVDFIQKHPEKSVDEFAGRPKADWDLKKDINETLLHISATDDDRQRIVKEGLDFKQEMVNSLRNDLFLDWYLQDPWVIQELKERGIMNGETDPQQVQKVKDLSNELAKEANKL